MIKNKMIVRTIDTHCGFDDLRLGVLLNYKLRNRDKLYYHCSACGIVFEDPNHTKPLIDVLKLTGRYDLPKACNPYQITSGYCDPCFNVLHERLKDRKELSDLAKT